MKRKKDGGPNSSPITSASWGGTDLVEKGPGSDGDGRGGCPRWEFFTRLSSGGRFVQRSLYPTLVSTRKSAGVSKHPSQQITTPGD